MMPNTLTQAFIFLISALFNLYLLVLGLRLILAYTHANYFNPITQFVVKLTQPIVSPLKKILPMRFGIEFATLLWIIIFEILKLAILGALMMQVPPMVSLFIFSLTETIKLILNIFFYAILLQAILSWVQPGYTPIGQLLMQLTSPIMRPIQRIVPPVGGFDISPIPAMLILQFLIILLP